MIMPEKLNKNLEQKYYTECVTPPPPTPQQKKIRFGFFGQNSLTRELKIRVVEFVLKKLLTYFEMLIVPHALQCVDGCFFSCHCIWHFASGILLLFQHPPPPSTNNNKKKSDLDSLSKFTY